MFVIGLGGIAGANQTPALFHKRNQVGLLVRTDLPDIAVQHDHPLRCQRMAGLLATRKEILRADRVVFVSHEISCTHYHESRSWDAIYRVPVVMRQERGRDKSRPYDRLS